MSVKLNPIIKAAVDEQCQRSGIGHVAPAIVRLVEQHISRELAVSGSKGSRFQQVFELIKKSKTIR